MEAGNTKKPRITTLDDLFGIPPSPIPNAAEVQIQEIELSKLHEFKGHPFKVLEDQALFDMAKSIQEIGQLTPAIVRPLENRPGEYELVSGNRRHRACLLAGLTHMRVIVKKMTRDEAIIQMVDANLQREHILPSERAMAYKMKLEAIKRQGMRTDLTSGQVGPKLDNRRSNAIVCPGRPGCRPGAVRPCRPAAIHRNPGPVRRGKRCEYADPHGEISASNPHPHGWLLTECHLWEFRHQPSGVPSVFGFPYSVYSLIAGWAWKR